MALIWHCPPAVLAPCTTDTWRSTMDAKFYLAPGSTPDPVLMHAPDIERREEGQSLTL